VETSRAGTRVTTLASPQAIGEELAERVLSRLGDRRFLLGCPTGRTPRPFYEALARRRADLSRVVFVMMDEYLDPHYEYTRVHSCHDFVRRHIQEPLGVRDEAIWFPDPIDPGAYDARIADAGGIDFFFLASGATDGHVAFNPPGTPRDSHTRIVALSETTRRDNLETFPDFGSIESVPRYGVSVGIDTIALAHEAVMVVWGESKRMTLARIVASTSYDASWPATVIHECATREIICDPAASGGAGRPRSPAPPAVP
jgi:glucosamine-6-phosphate deaminase